MPSLNWIFHCTAVIITGILLYEVLRLRKLIIRQHEPLSNAAAETEIRHPQNLYSLNENQQLEYLHRLKVEGSSVWCSGTKHTNRLCHFHHLCYVPDVGSFVFFHGINSTMVGVPKDRFDPALLDLSSVENHSAKYFNFVDVPLWAAEEVLISVDVVDVQSLILSRFHPDNIMHVIHDDLLPLFTTLKMIQPSFGDSFNLQVIFLDEHDVGEDGDYSDLYQIFTTHLPLKLSDLIHRNVLSTESNALCFTDVTVGLNKHSTWYQYGFYEPQGPLPHAAVTSQDILQFTRFVSRKLQITDDECNDLVALVTRKETRLILNELELCLALTKHIQKKVVSVSLETHSIPEIIAIFKQAMIVIGMHGSLLIFSIFLPPASIIIELFPYGINSERYTPYKTLAKIPHMDLVYRSWQNQDRLKSVPHPDRPKELGGINHLSKEQQNLILDSDEVAPHLCCSDPAWLFRIYQDTIININDVLDLVDSSLKERQEILRNRSIARKLNKNHQLDSVYTKHPANVNIMCHLSCSDQTRNVQTCQISLFCHWNSPWNFKYIGDVTYKIWIQKLGEEQYKMYSVSGNEFTVNVNIGENTTYYVWIRVFADSVPGPVTFTSCNRTSLSEN